MKTRVMLILVAATLSRGETDAANPLAPHAFVNLKYDTAETHVTASNTNGVLVGWYYSGGGNTTGFINHGGSMESFLVELPRVISTDIWDINDLGWLAGGYVQLNSSGQPVRHGFLAVPTPPRPIPLDAQWTGDRLVLTWYSKAFMLQSAPAMNGAFRNVPGATSPWTNSMTGDQQLFRLIAE